MDLCLTLAEGSQTSLVERIARYSGQVRFIEARLDYLEQPEIPRLPDLKGTELIATHRPEREGGKYRGHENERLQFLSRAARSGFAWVDLEHDVFEMPDLPGSTRIVRSYHSFDQFPDDLSGLFRRLKELPGDIPKIATTIPGTRELVRLLDWLESGSATAPFIVLGIGTFGQPSRLLNAFLGNHWTYVSETDENAAALGQFTLSQATKWYRLAQWHSVPAFYGVLGNPVSHSLSPPLHNHLFQHYKLDNLYASLPLDDLEAWFDYVSQSRLSFQGFSVTLPFKTEVTRFLQVMRSPVEAVNTLKRDGTSWEGFNTDYRGFLKPLTRKFSLKGKSALVLGNGGVVHTVVAALQNEGMQVTVVGRNPERVSSFARKYGCRHALLSDLPIKADLCVNGTPVGQHPQVQESPLSNRQLDFEVVYDLIYHPEETELLRLARSQGLQTISGMEMFIEQAALQFFAWTRIDPDRELMSHKVRELLVHEQ
ncbi:MAG: type I 3-dehydroquinate dehydratase [Acidobacteriota bacterium]